MFNRVWPVFNGVHGKYAGLCNPTPPCQLEIWTFSYGRSRRRTEKYKCNINMDFKLFRQFCSKGTPGSFKDNILPYANSDLTKNIVVTGNA